MLLRWETAQHHLWSTARVADTQFGRFMAVKSSIRRGYIVKLNGNRPTPQQLHKTMEQACSEAESVYADLYSKHDRQGRPIA